MITDADRIAVFKDGSVVEETAASNFSEPELLEHPFSRALCGSCTRCALVPRWS